MSRKLQRPTETVVLAALACGGLYVAVAALGSQFTLGPVGPHLIVLHTLLELASIFVGFSVFIVNWEASKQSGNTQSLFLATGFLSVAALDTMHTLSYPGMPDFVTPNDADKAIYFWIAARLWAALLLLSSAYLGAESVRWYLRRSILLAGSFLVSGCVLLLVLLFPGRLPPMYVEGTGPTTLKLLLEYLVIVINLLGIAGHMRAYRFTGEWSSIVLVGALVVAIFSELAFVQYGGGAELFIVLGHLYKVAAYYLIFRALLACAVRRPYQQLKLAKDRLERAVSELDARNRELDALDDVALTLSSTLKPRELLESAIEKTMRVLRARAGAVFLLEEGTHRLELAAHRGLTEDAVCQCLSHAPRLPYRVVPPADSFGQSTALDDLALVRSIGGTPARIAPLRTCMCAPVVSKGKTLGAIAMVGQEGRTFSPRDADLLTAIGYQLGLATENARLYERTDERLREKVSELQAAERRSRFLSEVGALLGSSTELGGVLDQVARRCTELVGEWCAIYLLDERDGLLRLEALCHPDESLVSGIREVLSRHPARVGEGFIGQIAESGEPRLVAELPPDLVAMEVRRLAQSLDEVALLRKVAPTSCIAAPMRVRDRVVGVLLIMAGRAGRSLSEADLSLMAELAGRLAVAVENGRLFQESQMQRRHLEAVISQMVDGVVIADRGGGIRVANAAAMAMLGGQLDRLVVGVEMSERGSFGGETAGCKPSLIARAVAGEMVLGEEISIDSATSQRILSASATPVRDELGEITGAVVVLRDVTAERQVERMKDEFVAVVSHELRTPLTVVLGYTDLLLREVRGPLLPKQKDALSAVRKAAQRLLALINDLLDMSRLEAGKQVLSLEPLDVSSAVERALSSVSLLASSREICLAQEVPEGLPPVLADEEQLQRILGNLLSNAIKFTPDGGRVVVSARLANSSSPRASWSLEGADEEPDVLAVTVTDTGVGVPPDQQARIWDKFQQADSSSRRPFAGTGLGLAITKGLVELHGGSVWVESEGIPGKGSTFGFTLPLARTDD